MKNINGKFYEIVLRRPTESLVEAKERVGRWKDTSTEYNTYLSARINLFKYLDVKEENKDEEFKNDKILMVREVGTDNYLGMFLYTTSFCSEALFEVTVDTSNLNYFECRYIVTVMAEHMFTEMGYEECKQWVYNKDENLSKFLTCELGYYYMNTDTDIESSVYYKSLTNKHTSNLFNVYNTLRANYI